LQRIKQDQNEVNKQVFGIIVLGHFLPESSGLGNQSIGTEVNNSLSEFISNQISSLASQIRNDLDFTVNYQAYQANNSPTNTAGLVKRNELQLAITKRFFNDRLSIDVGGDFDFGATDPYSNASTTGIAGDFAVEYKITPDGRVTGKVFSDSDYDIIDERNKTKNGIALTYRREFDTLKELFNDPEKKQERKEARKRKKELEALPPAEPVSPPATLSN